MKVLFIVKKQRFGYGGGGISSGLYNSAKFVVDMLGDILDVRAKVTLVDDNNDIDRVVSEFRPKIVIIEALWVEPEKFNVLVQLHPHVRWVVRNHSAMPFLAHEGIAMDWFFRYIQIPHVEFACNDPRTTGEFSVLANFTGLDFPPVSLLPNYYPTIFYPREHPHHARHINFACFGAIRPLKNQLIQAVAALRYAEKFGKNLHFHINVARVENEGEPILRNLRRLFDNLPRHKLVEHPWLPRTEFINLVRQMNLGLQCAYSETFNIVTADFVMNGVPVVTSREIWFVSNWFHANPNNSWDILEKMEVALRQDHNSRNVDLLRTLDEQAIHEWKHFLKRHA